MALMASEATVEEAFTVKVLEFTAVVTPLILLGVAVKV
jgi:hypothetical protein